MSASWRCATALGARREPSGASMPDRERGVGTVGRRARRPARGVGTRPFVAFWPGSLPRAEQVQLDWRVLLFVVGCRCSAAFCSGWRRRCGAVARLEQALRAGARTVAEARAVCTTLSSWPKSRLAVVLLVSAGCSAARSCGFPRSTRASNIRNVLVTRMAISPGALADPGHIRAAWQDMLDRARRVPGVRLCRGRYGADARRKQPARLLDRRRYRRRTNSPSRWPPV